MSMLTSAQAAIKRSTKQLNLTDKQLVDLLEPDHEHQHELEVNGEKHLAYRVQHSNKLGPYKGGTRFHPRVDLDEVRALALLMSIKTAAAGIPMGGGKGGVVIDTREYEVSHLEAVSRAYVRELHSKLGPDVDIPGPDVGTNTVIMDWMNDAYKKESGSNLDSFTGKSLENGGSEGREAATGRGGVIVLREYLKSISRDPKGLTVAVQGLGNVGFFFAQIAEAELGVRIVAVSDSKRTLAVNDFAHNRESFSFIPFAGHKKGIIEDLEDDHTEFLERDAILEQEVDVLVLAALGDVITDENVGVVRSEIILELANGPVEDSSSQTLGSKGVTIIPDVIANAGGVVVSYLEWLQNKADEHWTEARVNQRLEQIIVAATISMIERSIKQGITLKDSAFQIAVESLAVTK